MTSAFREAPLADGRPGPLSIRRISAAHLFTAGTAAGLSAVFLQLPWMGIAAAFGVPYGCGVLLLLFTTWADIKLIVAAAKGGVDA